MATVTVKKQIEDDIGKFYLTSLEFLQIKELDHECDDYIQFYYHVRDLTNPNSQYTALDKLGPILLYMFLKTRGILLVLPSFLNLYDLKYYEFTTDLKKVLKIYPDFNIRDKKSIIKKYIEIILKSFNIEQRVISHALTLFSHFYPLVQYKKEEIVAAVICALTSISFDLHSVSMRLICKKAGIRQSSLHRSILDKIFPYLGIPSSLGIKSSFELMKHKISKKTSLLEINVRTIEEEIEDLWRSGHSLDKIAKAVETPKTRVIAVLKQNLGDYHNYRIRYRITQQEIVTACRLRNKGLSYPNIAPRVHRPLKVTKKIVEDNLEDYLEDLRIKELVTKKLLNDKISIKLKQKEKLRSYQRRNYAEEKKERKLRLDSERSENRAAQKSEFRKLYLNIKEAEKRFRAMKPKSYLTLLRTLGELGISCEFSKEIVHSNRMDNTTYATCCFSIEGVAYRVFDSSNCMWVTSKGIKGNHIFNLVKEMFDKEYLS